MKLDFNITHLPRALAGAAAGVFGRLAARPARLLLDTARVQQKAFALATLLGMSGIAFAATPPNSAITNTATAAYSIGATALTGSSTVTVNTAACSVVGIKVDLMQYIPASGAPQAPAAASTVLVNPSMYSTTGLTAGPYAPLPNPTMLGNATPTALPATLLISPLVDTQGGRVFSYSRNEPIFVRVTSYDANINPAVADTVTVTLTTNGGDSEVLQLTETGPSTGIFVGAISSVFTAGATPAAHDGKITVASHSETINAVYNHSNCTSGANVATAASGLIDPYGIVFDSATGAPVNGATISIVDSVTSLPATVYCDDGVTVLPQPVTSGSATVCDATMAAGGYHLPLVAAGSYKLIVTPPQGHTFPSAVPAASLPATVGVPAIAPAILGNPGLAPGASYGGVFSLWGPPMRIDIPADPISSSVTIQKSAGKSVVGTGEFVPYTLTIANGNALAPLAGVTVADHTPNGFRYQKGSARLDGAAMADPVISADGRTLTFSLNIAAAATATVRYVLEVTPGAHTGMAENTAAATGAFTSNTAHASVMVREDLNRDKAILIGRVIDGPCDVADANAKGLANARIVLQDGTYVLTDRDGRWHIDNLRPGTHVVQLDLNSLPEGYEAAACEKNTRFAGRTYSQFVNVRGGTLWRADFHVQKKAPEAQRLTQTLSAKKTGKSADISLNLVGTAEVTGYSATLMLPDSAKYVPGSAKLNGAPVADPDIAGSALIFRSKAHPASWQDQYTVTIDGAKQNTGIQAMVRFTTAGRPAQNMPLAQITLTGSSLNIAETFTLIATDGPGAKPAEAIKGDDPSRLLEVLPYDDNWLATAQPGTEWLHPQESFHPNLPVMLVAVKHAPGQKLSLRVNDAAVDALKFDGVNTNAIRTVALSTWRGVEINEGDNKVELVISDADGKEISRTVRNIHYAATPDHIELAPQQSRLVADGKTRPVIAVRLLDKAGVPVRRGLNGEFLINDPYRSYDRTEGLERDPMGGRIGGKPRYEVKSDGIAYIELEPTTQSGEAILNFRFSNDRKHEVRAWLDAGQRDWILVGFGEGTLGQKTLSGNMEALHAADADKQLFDNNKLAFYAKGSIKGEYLLTIAYDTAKKTSNKQLMQAVDPTQYYTLYADASQAGFDAASATRLYVKLERRQFYAMFGDYNTGLTVTELSRYSRSLNGVKSEYKGEKVGYNAFATVTAQAYVKDEIPGNGTSGVYKLSRGNLVINSDKVRIETRDRFQSQIIVTTQTLSRYLDYDIDFDKGTLTFREPVSVRDSNFNPTYIIAEYESADPADERATFGGRGSFKPNKKTEIGATLVHEGTVGATADLHGVDATYQPDSKTKLHAEVASTTSKRSGVNSSGAAWLGEAQHHEDKWDAKAYVREQEGGFGMGQQAASETGTRKMGVDGRLKISDTMQLKGQAYRQDTLGTDAQQTMVEGRIDQRVSNNMNAYYGARSAQDKNAAGNNTSNQLVGGATYTMPDKKLSLRGSAEISEGPAGSVNAPDRVVLGADYKVTQQTKLFAEQEFARGENFASNTTRAGVRTQPWSGGEVAASMGNTTSNDAGRTYANLGMIQRWQISEHWQTSFNLDHSQTLRNTASPLNVNTPLPFVSATGDYTAVAVGAGYHNTLWNGNGRIEIRNAADNQQRNLQLGLQRILEDGRTMAAGFAMRNSTSANSISNASDLRVSYAHRPNDSKWIWLDRADYITQFSEASGLSSRGKKLVNNLNANYKPDRHNQISLQYGAKYVLDTIDGTEYKGYTDLIGTEFRHDINQDWDIGVFGSMMRSLNSGVRDYGLGASVGYNVMDNMWVLLGYNVHGLSDRDFTAAAYRARGWFITFRMKVDQDTLGLNKRGKPIQSIAPEGQ